MTGKTLYDKLWEAHIVRKNEDGTCLIYIDRHLLHEVTSPQAFAGLSHSGRKPWRLATNLAVYDHSVPTLNRTHIEDPDSRILLDTLDKNCIELGITQIPLTDPRQGIVHVVGPEQGLSVPGMTIVCGDSHTTTNGALGTLAFGIGTSEIEHVLASQTLRLKKSRNMRVSVNDKLGPGVTAKDIALHIIADIGTAGATGYIIEFSGETICDLSMESRMTLCNMVIEAGARSGMIAVDDKTIDYVKGRPYAPKGDKWDKAVIAWQDLHTDKDAVFDKEIEYSAKSIKPMVTWGTSPDMVLPIDGHIPDPEQETDPVKRTGMLNALKYMDLSPGTAITEINLDKIFIGSCTNSRIEDLRDAAQVLAGHHLASNIKEALVVPGSGLVKLQAEQEGLDKIFIDAGFEWREPGCSMCIGMNPDRLHAGERCASTSNRNFEGRQGPGGRTHLVSPAMAAAAAIRGHFVELTNV